MARVAKSTRQSRLDSPELLTWALHGIEQEITVTRQRLETLEAQARQLRSTARGAHAEGSSPAAAAASTPSAAGRPRKRRKLSAEARKRIADAQKRRWAKAKAKSQE